MSIIERTTRLLLTLFKGSSVKPAILNYYTADMKKIDDAFIDADNRIVSIESSLSSYSDRLDALELQSETATSELADHETRLQSIESIIETVSTANIEDLRRRLDAVELKVDTNATAIESLNEDVNLVEASIETINSILNTLDSRISVNENNILSLQTCCETVQTTLVNLQNQITANDSDITALQNRITVAENNIQGNATDITTLATQTRTNTADIAELKAKVNNLDPSGKTESAFTANGLTYSFVKLSGWTKLIINGTVSDNAIVNGSTLTDVISDDFASTEVAYSSAVQPATIDDLLINIVIDGKDITFNNVNGDIAVGTNIKQEVMYI